MVILLRLIVAHLLADFLFQTDAWVEHKRDKKLKSTFFYLHGLIHFLTTYILLAKWDEWKVPLFIGITHLIIDYWKLTAEDKTVNFIIDQILHFIILIASWLYITDSLSYLNEFLIKYFNHQDLWIILMGYLVAIWPMRFIIALATRRWRKDIQNDGLMDAGKWIGQIERILIVTFVLINKFEAIGFLITAKSIFRFSEINKERKEAEYILLGTLLSFVLAILWGILLSYLLKV